ncbi:non-canonical purine NTP pyrophosphatase [Acinetobacter baumannii]|uniref:non-canonical purine NTP pyrophosphatase n=1 Tax=Acinetobacter baumannii TaxID=470 RepID=UPI001B68DAF7|nr:non-canonical purine NTP pyrophosphatase [Acinetobacter baumannii]MDC5647775.1 non-canonical purine NTP pyrophosphatase [Acinetobacter baumannii]MEC6739299.1 non-canonical purine NTP pyrophosphatase [Acinetobacter baumannii]UDY20410.1 dITP/XTP pyrophosphatase [Acinetobacter baumannii]HCQ9967769.1 non-canonical purine NTP pyrophosphatase [Acinetobacter baumannii]
MKIIVTTGNPCKLKELNHYMQGTEVSFVSRQTKIEELQTFNESELLNDKLEKAFAIFKEPVLVEHASLYLEILNNFPGGLTEIFWETLQADKFCELFKGTKIVAKTSIGYCDGRKTYNFEGISEGIVSNQPKGDRSFQWDCVFIPMGYEKTYAELGDEKLEISMRKKAFDLFKKFIEAQK